MCRCERRLAQQCESDARAQNDVFLADEANVQIITGPNMWCVQGRARSLFCFAINVTIDSGKSTLIRQTALIVVLAHIGSFVPAEWCSLRVGQCALRSARRAARDVERSSRSRVRAHRRRQRRGGAQQQLVSARVRASGVGAASGDRPQPRVDRRARPLDVQRRRRVRCVGRLVSSRRAGARCAARSRAAARQRALCAALARHRAVCDALYRAAGAAAALQQRARRAHGRRGCARARRRACVRSLLSLTERRRCCSARPQRRRRRCRVARALSAQRRRQRAHQLRNRCAPVALLRLRVWGAL